MTGDPSDNGEIDWAWLENTYGKKDTKVNPNVGDIREDKLKVVSYLIIIVIAGTILFVEKRGRKAVKVTTKGI